MDKYEYRSKTEQMLELMENGSYRKAAEIADTIDWKRVRNAAMLMSVSDIYEKIKDYQKSYEILNLAYRRAEGSRKVISRLCTLALKTGNVDEAIDYYDDFIQTAPKDPNQYILRYQILRAQRAPIEQQIEALEEYKKSEYIEEWAYELAKLYQEAGMTAECLEECDDLILWFSEGQYVYKAMELKMQYKPLTPSQQEKYDKRYEQFSMETEEMPDVVSYAGAKTADEAGVEYSEELSGKEENTGEDSEDSTGADAVSKETGDGHAEAEEVLKHSSADTEAIPQRKKIGDTMPLDEALRKLLHPENEEVTAEEAVTEKAAEEEEPEMADLEEAIDEIESVADMDIVEKISGEKKNAARGMKEILPEQLSLEETQEMDPDQISGQMNLEDILTGWEGEPEEDALSGSDVEDFEEDLFETEAEETGEDLLEAEAEEIGEDLFEAEAEEIGEDLLETGEEEFDEDIEDGEIKGDNMESKKTTEPILPPDIQRMIDEIEGVIPAEEEKPEKAVEKPVKKVEEPRENMGKVTESLRIDDEDFAEDFFDDDEEFEEDFEEEYAEEAEEELAEEFEEDYFDDGEDLDDEEFEEEFEEEHAEEAEEELAEEFEEDYFDDGEDLDEDERFREELPDLDEEFCVNPDHAELEDDREIPDDDDNMDILSATTPLSRKETAKMIATGKTAPLPLDEISDALSMDTGFIVHGRYDLETQSGIGTRAGLTEEQKKLFSYFVPVRGMSEQLVDVLEQDKNCTNRNGTSKAGNLLIIGNKGNGKTVLAVDVVKAIQKQRNIKQGKVAIVTGDSLNKKRISDIFDKLHGGALIIEKAGRMNEKTVARLNKAMEGDTGELLIVLEEQRKPLDRLLISNREFRRKFTSRLEIPIFINDELVTFGQTYAQENGYRIDEMGILALYSKIDSLQREDHAVTVAEVKEIMDEAIGHSQKASAKKLVKRVFGKNTDEADRIILSENDFNI